MQHIIKSFSQLSELNRRQLFEKDGKLKPLNKKFAVSVARQLADGFDFSLRKEPSKSQYRRAREIIKEFYSAANEEKVKIVRPSRKNRKYYADYADMSKKFKVYAMPVFSEKDNFKIKKGRIKRIGEFSETEFFKFDSRLELVKNPKKETNKLYGKIEKKLGKKRKYAVKIKCGRHEYKTLYEDKSPHVEISKWLDMYGKKEVKKWCMGFQVYTFKNQKPVPTVILEKKGNRKNTFRTCKKCKTKNQCKIKRKCKLK